MRSNIGCSHHPQLAERAAGKARSLRPLWEKGRQ
jgi:hypothetical protein